MSIRFRELFSFSRAEISSAFEVAKLQKRFLGLRMLIAPATNTSGKMLIVTSRKVGKAHDRNLLRRRLKALYYEHRLFERPYTLIVIAYSQALEHSPQALLGFLEQTLPLSPQGTAKKP